VPDRMKEQPGPRQPPQAGALARGLSDIEVALLGLLSIRPMTGYEIRHSYARGLAPWWETPRTQIYPKLRELKQRGLVRDELVLQQGKPNKRVYTIEPAGSQALMAWLRQDISWPDMKHQMMMRLFFGNLLPLPAFRQLLTDYTQRMATLVESLRVAHTRFSAALTGPYRTSVFFELLSLEHLIKIAELEVSGTTAILNVLARADGAFTMENGDQASQLLEAIREQAQSLLSAVSPWAHTLRAAHLFEQDVSPVQVAHRLRIRPVVASGQLTGPQRRPHPRPGHFCTGGKDHLHNPVQVGVGTAALQT